eukprot:gene7385-10059_t
MNVRQRSEWFRFAIGIQYCGTKYSGIALNSEAKLPSIISTLQVAMEKCFGPYQFQNLKVSSRTDAGVHALRNVIHVDILLDLDNKWSQYSNLTYKMKKALNFHLNPDQSELYVRDITLKESDFNCRYNAKSRTYMYRIIYPLNHNKHNNNRILPFQNRDNAWITKHPLDINFMRQQTQCLIGEHDFKSFQSTGCQSNTSLREVKSIQIDSMKENFEKSNPLLKSNTLNMMNLLVRELFFVI